MIFSTLSSLCSRLYYALRLMFSAYFIGATVLMLIFALVTVNLEQWNFARASFDPIVLMFTAVMPIVSILLTANMFAEEWEERAFPLIWTYPVPKWLLLLERTLVLAGILVLYHFLVLAAVHYGFMELTSEQMWEIVKLAAPTHLFLCGLTLFVSLLGRNLLIGMAAGAGYWLVEMITRGLQTKHLFLFQSVPGWQIETVDTITNRWWVFSLGCMFIALSFVMFILGGRWLARK